MRARGLYALAALGLLAIAVGLGVSAGTGERGTAAPAGPEAELGSRPGGGKPDRRPNVLVVMTDDQRLSDMPQLPVVRRKIGKRGVTFRNSFATFPLCCPSRASFLTGQYTHNHGLIDNNPAQGGGFPNYDDAGSLPIALRRGGYRTGLIGKYLNGYDGKAVPEGWDYWAAKFLGGTMFGYKLNIQGELTRFRDRPSDYQTDVLTRLSAGFIRRHAKRRKPFFLFTSYTAPHTESLPRDFPGPNPRPAPRHKGEVRGVKLPKPPSFNEDDVSDKPSFIAERGKLSGRVLRKQRRLHRARLGSLLAVDEGVGELIAELRRSGELDNTYVFFVSDNGYMRGEHRTARKTLLYEESVRVPMLIRGPGIPEGERRAAITANIDLAPTIYDITGTAPLREPDGRTILPYARKASRGLHRDILLENNQSQGVHTRRYVYIEHAGNERELYDLARDPFQLDSVHDRPAFAAIQAQLAARLDELRDCAGSACRQ